MTKRRLSASVDAELLRAAEAAVTAGRVGTVSAWVNDAFRLKVEHDRRLRAMARFIEEYEKDHGEITREEMRAAVRRDRARAIRVRPKGSARRGRTRRRRAP